VYALLSEGDGLRFPFLLLPSARMSVIKRPVNVEAVTDSTGTAVFTQLGFQTRYGGYGAATVPPCCDCTHVWVRRSFLSTTARPIYWYRLYSWNTIEYAPSAAVREQPSAQAL
jgi:hypothetical protein